MQSLDGLPSLTPLQRAIYEVDQLGLNLRDSMRLVTQRMGFFIGQQRYLEERAKIAQIVAEHGLPADRGPHAAPGPRGVPDGGPGGLDPLAQPREATHQIGSP